MNVPSSDEITCRLATLDDYEGVININTDVYGGLDYLPKLYHSFVQNPLRVTCVAVVKGQIVAFEMMFVVDGGESVVYQAGRVMPGKQGMGISRVIGQFAHEQTVQRFPKIKKGLWTSVNTAEVNKVVKSKTGKLETVRPRLSFDLSPNQLASVVKSGTFSEIFTKYEANLVQKLNPFDVEQLLQRRDVLQMSPDGYWFIAFEPLGALSCNASIIAHNLRPAVFVSYDNTSGNPSAISFGTAQSVKFGTRYRMDFYFDPNKRDVWEDLFIGHMMRQIVHTCDLPKVELSFSAFHHDGLDHTMARKVVFEDLGVSKPKARDIEVPGYLIAMDLTLFFKDSKL